MSVKIRMRRMGANRDISFRVVVTDSRAPRDGQYLELVGWYDPKKEGTNFALNTDRIDHWRKCGAEISVPVQALVRRQRRIQAAVAKA